MSLPVSPPKQQIIDKINNYLQTNGNITAIEHKEIELLLVDAIYGAQIGDIKEIAVNDAYIVANFQTGTSNINEGLGLVNGERYGWAICNGKNGTINKMGKVAIGYDSINYTLGSVAGSNTGGEKTHTLLVTEIPPHTHKISGSTYDNGDPGNYALGAAGTEQDFDIPTKKTGGLGSTSDGNTTTGSTVPHNNMQPYIVTLFIQRVAV